MSKIAKMTNRPKFWACANSLKTHHVVIYLMRAYVLMVLLYSVVPPLASLAPERQLQSDCNQRVVLLGKMCSKTEFK